MILDIRADITEVHEALKQVDINLKHINKKILTALTIKMKNAVSKKIYTVLKKKDGQLKKSIYKWSKSDTAASVGSMMQRIAQTHEYGKKILPKKKKYLSFKVDDVWIRTKEVNIPARPFFFATVDTFIGSSEFQATIEKTLDKALKKAGFNATST
jgi:phage gpG-like protein